MATCHRPGDSIHDVRQARSGLAQTLAGWAGQSKWYGLGPGTQVTAARGRVGLDCGSDGRVEAVVAQSRKSVASDFGLHGLLLQFSRRPMGPGLIEVGIEVGEHVRCGGVDVGDRFRRDDDPHRPGLDGCETAHLVAERACVREQQWCVESVDRETGQMLGGLTVGGVVVAAEVT